MAGPRIECKAWVGYELTRAEARAFADMENLIRWYFPPREHRRACWVALQRSGLEPLAFNRAGIGTCGLFGLVADSAGFDEDEHALLFNPVRNVALAYRIWRQYGWSGVCGGREPDWPVDLAPDDLDRAIREGYTVRDT